ncbi:unnamed protein product [Linum tenue]|uniref:Chitin-binding type-1 domain-containing protein n=1 Tax=Linum tenue TaxID=586396 RepID=A0AAV0S5A3_9ROSI|nr:unnamed protein product [Linum tenue]
MESLLVLLLLLVAVAGQLITQSSSAFPPERSDHWCGKLTDGTWGACDRANGRCCGLWGYCGDGDSYCDWMHCTNYCPSPPTPPPPASGGAGTGGTAVVVTNLGVGGVHHEVKVRVVREGDNEGLELDVDTFNKLDIDGRKGVPESSSVEYQFESC